MNKMAAGIEALKQIQALVPNYKDVSTLMARYQELNQNRNLQTYMIATSSDFVALCRKIVAGYYANSFAKIQDIMVYPEYGEIKAGIETPKWEDTEIFRFYRTAGSVGEMPVREFHAKVTDAKVDRGICFTAGAYTDTAKKFVEGRPIDIVEKTGLIKLLKRIN